MKKKHFKNQGNYASTPLLLCQLAFECIFSDPCLPCLFNNYFYLTLFKAQEDAEVLRSLVVPLEEEIRALKEKLRAADEQIQQYEVRLT